MDQDRLDKFIKKQVEDHETSIDPDLLWQKIQAKQNEEEKPKRRVVFLWWWLGGAGLLAGLAWLIVFNFSGTDSYLQKDVLDSDEQTLSKTATETKSKAPIADLNTKDAQMADTKVGDTTLSADDAGILDAQDAVVNSDEATAQSDEVSISKSVNSKTNASSNSVDRFDNSFSEKTSESASESKSKWQSKSKADNTRKTNTLEMVVTTNEIKIENTEAIDTAIEEEEKEIAKIETNVPNNPIDTPTENERTEPETKDDKAIASFEPRDSTSIDPPTELADNDEETENNDGDDDEVENNNSDKKKWSISTGAALTYGRGFRTLSFKDSAGSLSQDYLNTRNNMETSLDAARINLDFMFQYNDAWYLKSGIEYGQITERFDYYIEWDSMEVRDNELISIIYDINGNKAENRGSAPVSTTNFLRKKTYNRYRSFDIPLIIGYESKQKDRRLGWFAEAGASINVWFQSSGEILNTDYELTKLKDSNLFKTQTGISLIGSAGLTYIVTDKLSIWMSPDFKYSLSSVNSATNPLDQKYLNVGLRAGVRYSWKEK